MSKELRIDFQGVIALVPDRKFAEGPKRIDVLLRDLREARTFYDLKGTPRMVGAHNAWLEFPPDARTDDDHPPRGIAVVSNGWTNETKAVYLLEKESVEIRPDDRDLPAAPVTVDPSVLAHLAVYHGRLKTGYQPKADGSDELAASFTLSGGSLTLVEKTSESYYVPLHDRTISETGVATTVRWTIPFEREIVLRFPPRPRSPLVRLRPAGDDLQLAVRNRELDELLKPFLPAEGGQDDPEFVVYGDLLVGGQPQVLSAVKGSIPSGRRACGLGGVQPVQP